MASVWDLTNLPPTINTNNGSATYSIPSSDVQCANASLGSGGQMCAVSQACAGFNVNFIPGTNCIQGSHFATGRACGFCRMHGANASANSSIVISCPSITTQGTIAWTPQLQDSVGRECSAQMRDPVVVRYRNASGSIRDEVLFDFRASNLDWVPQDNDGDGEFESARVGPRDRKTGHVTLLKRTSGPPGGGQESRILIRWDDNLIVTESEATGEFINLRGLPSVGQPFPSEGIRLPGTYQLPFEASTGEMVESIEMGGGGDAGQDIPRAPGDVNGDGCVDDRDLLIVLFSFGQQGGPADLNGDGIVDDSDLLLVLFNFGNGC